MKKQLKNKTGKKQDVTPKKKRGRAKKIRQILWLILLMFICFFIFLSLPSVQTFLTKKITEKLKTDLNIDINIDCVAISLTGEEILKDVLIRDHKKDTLFYVQRLTTDLDLKEIYNGTYNLDYAQVEGLKSFIKTYKGEDNNSLNIWIDQVSDKDDDKESDFRLSGNINLINSSFYLIDENNASPNLFTVENLNADLSEFLVQGSDVDFILDDGNFTIKGNNKELDVSSFKNHFKYTSEKIELNQLYLTTKRSQILGNIAIIPDSIKKYENFYDNVKLNIDLNSSKLNLGDLKVFIAEDVLKSNEILQIENVDFNGTLNQIKLKNTSIAFGQNSNIKNDYILNNFFSKDKDFYIKSKKLNATITAQDLKKLLPEYKSSFALLNDFGNIKAQGEAVITPSAIDYKGTIKSKLGDLETEITLEKYTKDNISYKGFIKSNELKIGKLIGVEGLKSFGIKANFKGENKDLKKLKLYTNATVSNLNYQNHNLDLILIDGEIENDLFNGLVKVDDEFAKLSVEGTYQLSGKIKTKLEADITHLNLKELGFSTDNVAEISTLAKVDLEGPDFNKFSGTISLLNTNYKKNNKLYNFDELLVTAKQKENLQDISIDAPSIIKGNIYGKFKQTEIHKVALNAIGKTFANYKPLKVAKGQYFDFDFNISDTFIELFVPEIQLDSGTYIAGSVDPETNDLKLTFNSPGFNYLKERFEETKLIVDTKNPFIQTALTVKQANLNNYNIEDFKFFTTTANDTMYIRSSFKGGKSEKYKLKLYQTLDKNQNLIIGIKNSELFVNNTNWIINETDEDETILNADFIKKEYYLNNLFLKSGEQKLGINALYKNKDNWDIDLNIEQLDLAKALPSMKNLKVKGITNGIVHIVNENGILKPESDIQINQLGLNDFELGRLINKTSWDELEQKHALSAVLSNNNIQNLVLNGFIDIQKETPTIDAKLQLNELKLSPLNLFLEGVLENIRGDITGEIAIKGDLTDPDYEGILTAKKTGMKVPYLNTDYSFENEVKLPIKKGKFIFNNLTIHDTVFDSKGILNGKLIHDRFLSWDLDLGIDAQNLLALNTTILNGEQYYGKIFGKGSIAIYGPAEALTIDVDAKTVNNSTLTLNLELPSEVDRTGVFRFKKHLLIEDLFADLDDITDNLSVSDLKGLTLNLNINVTENTLAKIILNENNGSEITARGSGDFKLNINTVDRFNMFGEYKITSGDFLFNYGFIKKFYLEPNSSIKWQGDPYNADLNIGAVLKKYTTNIGEFLEINTNRNYFTHVTINLLGKILNPLISFDISIPDAPESIQSALTYRINSEEEEQNQAAFLLSAGKFNTAKSSFIASTLQTSAFDLVLNELSKFASNLDDDLTFGLDYSAGQRAVGNQDQLNLSVNYNLSDRMRIKGSGGLPISLSDQNQTTRKQEVTGEFELEYDLNKRKNLIAKVFTKPTDIGVNISNSGTDYTTGVGITYKENFDNLKELREKIFGKKKEKSKSDSLLLKKNELFQLKKDSISKPKKVLEVKE